MINELPNNQANNVYTQPPVQRSDERRESDPSAVEFVVPRIEGYSVSTIAFVKARIENPRLKNEQDFLLSLKRAVTNWINASETGIRAWKETSQDFNVGDLAQWIGDEALVEQLRLQGIFDLDVEAMNVSHVNWLFDTVLANSDLIEEKDETEF